MSKHTQKVVAMIRKAEDNWDDAIADALAKAVAEQTPGDELAIKSVVPTDQVWVGPRYCEMGIFVLGESWYGDYAEKLVTDHGWIQSYLNGTVTDRMYTRMANACKMTRHQFWERILFTNFVLRVGNVRSDRPTRQMYLDARPRLRQVLAAHKPRAVWILGLGQSEFSGPVIAEAGIPFEVVPHPTSYGLSNQALGDSWQKVVAKSAG